MLLWDLFTAWINFCVMQLISDGALVCSVGVFMSGMAYRLCLEWRIDRLKE